MQCSGSAAVIVRFVLPELLGLGLNAVTNRGRWFD